MLPVYTRTALVICGGSLLGLLLGVLLGSTAGWLTFLAVLLVMLMHHIRHLAKLQAWITAPDPADVPSGTGIWSDIYIQLHRRQRSNSRRRMRLARALARSRQAGRALPYGVAILDQQRHIIWCNDSAEGHFGIDLARDAGQPITNLVRQPEFLEYIAGRDFSRPLDMRAMRAGGTLLAVQFVPYEESHWLLLSRDVTQAARLETMRRDFVANVSHELRTPLTVLIGFLETIRELELDPQRTRDYLNLMAEQGKRMQRIIDDLLILSTLESAPEPSPERIDLPALLQRVRSDAEALSAGRHHVVFDGACNSDLTGAEHEVLSAFTNLASNAVRYTPEGGTITLRWRDGADGGQFTVEDTGAGIAPEHIPRLTERFYRVDRGRSRESGGTGLGLAIVKHALMRHQATLDIESELGRGSRFIARFPARRLLTRAETTTA